jgi:hypothetical protein
VVSQPTSDPDRARAYFQNFAERQAPENGSPLYQELSLSVARKAGYRPLSLIEVGTSAGLNLHWDRYQHHYHFPSGKWLQWGDNASPVRLATEVRGEVPLPSIPSDLSVAWRLGIDLKPIDISNANAMLWLRALIFPEHLERHHTIEAAASIAREHRVNLSRRGCGNLIALTHAAGPRPYPALSLRFDGPEPALA